jgi:UDP-glucose 4-epimerase
MRVLVTGGAGFIGSHVVDKLADRRIEPRIFDVVPSPHHAPGEIDTRLGDLTDLDALRSAAQGCDAVIHLAAIADVNHVAADPGYAELVNSRGTFNVVEAARLEGVGRVVYGSTIWVYNAQPGLADEDTNIGLPSHLYTATKLAGEMYCKSYSEQYGLDCTILRFGIPFGPRARAAAVVPAFVKRALAGEPLTIAGDGSQGRRFVYVEDLADGVARALAPHAANRVFNLVGDETVTVKQIASIVQELIGDVDILHVESRAGDFSGTEVSGERAARELEWEATTPFVEGVRRYIDWLRGPIRVERVLKADAADPDPVG